MAHILVGIGQLKISKRPEDFIKTMALGSSIAVIFSLSEEKVAGLAHVVLPDSMFHSSRAAQLPGYFADTAIPYFTDEFKKVLQVEVLPKIQVKLVGGSSILDPDDTFNIGQKNLIAIETILTKNNLDITAKDVGKNYSRAVSVEVFTGKVFVSAPGRGKWEL
jgi:chemotaxis protein CheD